GVAGGVLGVGLSPWANGAAVATTAVAGSPLAPITPHGTQATGHSYVSMMLGLCSSSVGLYNATLCR
ncbi:hypothetical protein V8C86DRAFT_2496411, partial [Haematococcus lacustris]